MAAVGKRLTPMSQRISGLAAARPVLLLAAVVVAAALFFGIPIRYRVPSAWIYPEQGHAYVTPLRLLWPLVLVADDAEAPAAGATRLSEDGRSLGPAHVSHASIRELGGGRYSHWRGTLYFSTSDNSDPRRNGRRYVAAVRLRLAPEILLAALVGLGAAALRVALRWYRAGLIRRSDLLHPTGLWAGAALGFGAAIRAEGIAFWLLIGLAAVLVVWAVATTHRTFGKGTGRRWGGFGRAASATLLVVSMAVALAAAETFLLVWSSRPVESGTLARDLEAFGVEVPPEVLRAAARRRALVTLPGDLERQPLVVEGAARAYLWHGALHVHDGDGMRRAGPFPAARPDVLRVMVVGDSLTYGTGIDERWTYSRRLETLLEPDYRAEVLNLGVGGHQSGDVVRTVRQLLAELRPDLVVYGVCHNDFLPSGRDQTGDNRYAWAIPVADSVKAFFIDRSRLVRLSAKAYDVALLRMDLRDDYFDEILNGFAGYQERFGRDVAELDELVRSRGLPPVVALVLDHKPAVDPRGRRVTRAAESRLQAAGMDVIETDPYYRHFDGRDFRVSRWEGHPNEIANAIWAVMLDRHLRSLAALRRFCKHPPC